MKNLLACLIALFLSVNAAPAQDTTRNLQFHFGAVCDGIADDTAALTDWLLAGQSYALTAGPGRCRATAPLPVITWPVQIVGPGASRLTLIRDFNASYGSGFLHLSGGSSGSQISDLAMESAPGRTGGHALYIQSTAALVVGYVNIRNLTLSGYSDNWSTTLRVDGSLRTTEPRGAREISFENMRVFGAASYAVQLKTCISCRFMGGGFYPASGTSVYSGGLQISGTTALPSQQVVINVNTLGKVNISDAIDVVINAPVIGIGSGYAIENSGSAIRVQVMGQTYPGTGIPNAGVMSNWQSSSALRPDGSSYR